MAILLRPSESSADLLLIERAAAAHDPWSGHMAFPGGRREERDESLLDTAIRETWEETDIDLARVGEALGRLEWAETLSKRLPALSVLPFVFRVPEDTRAGPPNAEVASSLWIPVPHFADPGAATHHRIRTGDVIRRFPAFATEGGVVWGMTHRILTDLLGRLAQVDPRPDR